MAIVLHSFPAHRLARNCLLPVALRLRLGYRATDPFSDPPSADMENDFQKVLFSMDLTFDVINQPGNAPSRSSPDR